ncbi:O-antigen ligase family protein [Altererythrobacter sp. CAU 1778]
MIAQRAPAPALPCEQAAALAYLLFLVALPPAIGAALYAALIFAGSAIYLLPQGRASLGQLVFGEYLAVAGIVLLYLLLSTTGWFAWPGRLRSGDAVAPQAAGLLLVCACIPGLTKVSRVLFADRARLLPFAVLATLCLWSALTWRRDESIILEGQLYGVLAPALFIQFSIFIAVVTLTRNRAARVVLLALPLVFMGAASNAVIQLSLIALVLAGGHVWTLRTLAVLLGIGVLTAIYSASWLDPLVAGDTNSLVRLHLWREAWSGILSHPLGLGFGSGFTETAAMNDPVIAKVYKYDAASALSIANHSSLLDVTLRLGLPGLIAFVLVMHRALAQARGTRQYLPAAGAIAMVLVAGAMNPILESARSALFVAFAIGFARGIALDRQSKPALRIDRTVSQPSPAERRRALAAQAQPRTQTQAQPRPR